MARSPLVAESARVRARVTQFRQWATPARTQAAVVALLRATVQTYEQPWACLERLLSLSRVAVASEAESCDANFDNDAPDRGASRSGPSSHTLSAMASGQRTRAQHRLLRPSPRSPYRSWTRLALPAIAPTRPRRCQRQRARRSASAIPWVLVQINAIFPPRGIDIQHPDTDPRI